jgi:hypothetical protein
MAKQGEMGGARVGEKKVACTVLVGKPEGNRLIGRYEHNIKMALKEIG